MIPNQNLFRIANERTTFADAFRLADDVLASGVRGVTDLMVMPGLINLDFADIRTVMGEMGKAMMGTGEATGDRRALDAAEAAISNPLLDDTSMKGARGMLINVTGGLDMTLFEVDEACNRVRDEVDPEANIIFGSTFDASMEGRMRVSVVATGIESEIGVEAKRPGLSLVTGHGRPASFSAAPAAAPTAPAGSLGGSLGATVAMAAQLAAAPMQQGAIASATAQPAMAHTGPLGAPAITAAAPRYETVGAAAIATEIQAAAQTMARPALNPALKPEAPTKPAPSAQAVIETDGPFIAPKPVDPGLPPVQAAAPLAPTARPDPFAEAAYANAGGRPAAAPAAKPAPAPRAEKPRAPSLFERVTGAAFRKAEAPEPRTAEPRMAEPRMADPIPAKPVEAKPAEPALRVAPVAQPSDRPAASQSADDLLDIPAFLRRQAN